MEESKQKLIDYTKYDDYVRFMDEESLHYLYDCIRNNIEPSFPTEAIETWESYLQAEETEIKRIIEQSKIRR